MRATLPILLVLVLNTLRAANPPGPGPAVDAQPFNPEEWQRQGVSTRMVPWVGTNLVFLTEGTNHDPRVMTALVGALDRGWETYADLTGRRPGLHKQVLGKPSFVALPKPNLSCGVGCGYLGVTGVELGKFYTDDYPRLIANPRDVPHYLFYEMGRNFYTFGNRHSEFTTGFAVFMRYVMLDTLGLDDAEADVRQRIERVESRIGDTDATFARFFTNHSGLGEKDARLRDLQPCDQPVTYASAMLRLRREYGGNDWVRRFFHHLADVPEVRVTNEADALRQAHAWFLCACLAAGRDLSADFHDRWRMEIDDAARKALAACDWKTTTTWKALLGILPEGGQLGTR